MSAKVKSLLFIALFSVIQANVQFALAQSSLSNDQAGEAAEQFASNMTSHLFSSTPLLKGRWDFRIVPVHLSYTEDSGSLPTPTHQALTGWGAAFGGSYSMTDHWSLNVLAFGFSASGNGVIYNSQTNSFGSDSATGLCGSFAVAWDRFNEPERFKHFKMPILLGVGYYSLNQASQATSTNATMTVNRTLNSPVVTIGISPQVTFLKDYQIAASVLTSQPLQQTTDSCSYTGNTFCSSVNHPDLDSVTAAGIEFKYIPLNLAIAYSYPILGSEFVTSISLKWEVKFGGKPEMAAPLTPEPSQISTPVSVPPESVPSSGDLQPRVDTPTNP